MPFPMKIQPIDSQVCRESIRNDSAKPLLKSRLKRLFDRPFPSVLRSSSAVTEKQSVAAGEAPCGKDGVWEFEPSSVCLDKMVRNFIEESNEKPSAVKCARNRCNCFNGNSNDSSDDEFDFSTGFGDSITNGSFGDSSDSLKTFILCASVTERNLLADTSKIVEKNKNCKRKDDLRKFITDGLLALRYDASICKSRWEKCSSYPAGEYEYIDVIVEAERLLIDVDFKSEFEIARSTSSYKTVLQCLPYIFVGKADRLQQIVSIVSEAAKQSLKKKGMHIPPWRKTEYIKNKWLSPHIRTTPPSSLPPFAGKDAAGDHEALTESEIGAEKEPFPPDANSDCGELDLLFGDKTASSEMDDNTGYSTSPEERIGDVESKSPTVVSTWQLPAIKPKSKVVVTGLASLLKEKP